MAQEYKVIKTFKSNSGANNDGKWQAHGKTFQTWVASLDGIEGWVQVNKEDGNELKEGDEIYGNLLTEKNPKTNKTYLKFKSESRPQDGTYSPQKTQSSDKMDYVVQMLEELTGRTKKPDVVLEDIDEGQEFSLEDIPF